MRFPSDRSNVNEAKWRRYLRFFSTNPAADFDDELRDHLDSTIESLIAQGMSPDAARQEALRRFGDVARVRGTVNRIDRRHSTSVQRLAIVEEFLYDLRHAARGLRRSPAFTVVAALSIALGVAANTAVFSIVNAMLFRPVTGVRAPDDLVRVYENHHSPFDWKEIAWFRDNASSFTYFVGERLTAMSFRASGTDTPERIHTSYVTRGFFPALGVGMALGRTFDEDELSGTHEPVAVITHGFWQRRFGGDPAVLGRTVVVSGHPVTIVGVAAPDFSSSMVLWNPDLFVPFSIAPLLSGRPLTEFGGSFYVTARLTPGTNRGDANRELGALMSRLARTDSARYDRTTVRVDHVRGVNAELRQSFALASIFLMATVAMVLLIACANVANLLLGRGAARRTEIGVRLAIGAGRARLVRQLLTESLLIAALGSALGFAAAWGIVRILPSAIPPEAGLGASFFAPDRRVLFFTAVLCLVTTLLFGTLPAMRAASAHVMTVMKGSDVHLRRRRRGFLVSAQAALCVVLLSIAALFLRSAARMQGVDPGFRAEGVIDVGIDLGMLGKSAAAPTTFTAIVQRAKSLPGVQSASLVGIVPLSLSNMETRVLPTDMTVTDRRDAPSTYFNVVSPGYFANLQIPLVGGRDFRENDSPTSPRVAVIGATAARRLWPSSSALGKRFHWGSIDGPLVEVVGVVRDADYVSPGEAAKTVIYMPLAQEPRVDMTLQVRTAASVAEMRRALWDLVHEVAPALPPPSVVSMTDEMAVTLLPVRAGSALLGAFGALALLLAAAGIYGVASYSVARRTRELGVRSALGATRARLVGLVLLESSRQVGIGALVGVALTAVAGFGLNRMLYGLRPVEPVVLFGVPLFIGVIAVLATLAPARRAARADPVTAIRSE